MGCVENQNHDPDKNQAHDILSHAELLIVEQP